MSAQIDAAIRAHAKEHWGDALPVDWILVVATIDPNGTHSIGTETSRDNMPRYVASGLLSEGIRLSDPNEE